MLRAFGSHTSCERIFQRTIWDRMIKDTGFGHNNYGYNIDKNCTSCGEDYRNLGLKVEDVILTFLFFFLFKKLF